MPRLRAGRARRTGRDAYLATAALAREIVSPGDKTWGRLAFYARHDVDELLTVDPQERKVNWPGVQADAR